MGFSCKADRYRFPHTALATARCSKMINFVLNWQSQYCAPVPSHSVIFDWKSTEHECRPGMHELYRVLRIFLMSLMVCLDLVEMYRAGMPTLCLAIVHAILPRQRLYQILQG